MVLATGLEILRIVAEADRPLTATAIAQRVGLHVSSVSRTLAVLAKHGYLRKPTYHSFAADLGVLALAGQAASHLPEVACTRAPIEELALRTGLQATLAAIHRDEVVYLHQSQRGQTNSALAGGFPLHLSVVGLRLLLDVPREEALVALGNAERRYGWPRPTTTTPPDAASCLAAARERLRDGVLRLDAWDTPGMIGVAMRVNAEGRAPLAIALVGEQPEPDADASVCAELARGAETVRSSLLEKS